MAKSIKDGKTYTFLILTIWSLEKLWGIDCSYQADSWLNNLLFATKQVVKPFLFCSRGYYSLPDLIRRQRDSLQVIQCLWREVTQINFEAQTKYGVPIILIEGRYDYHVSSALAKEYFDRIETEKQFYWFEESCHFPQWSESERFVNYRGEIVWAEKKRQQKKI